MTPPSEPARTFFTERPIAAQRLAQNIMRRRCARHLRFILFPSEAANIMRRYGVESEALSPLLSQEGQAFEHEKVEVLSASERVQDLRNKSANDFLAELQVQPPGCTFYYQPKLEGRIGGWSCAGEADLIEAVRGADGSFEATVIDIKASRRETVGFRLQVAFYARLLRAAINQSGLVISAMRGAVVARDSDFSVGAGETFDLALYDDEIERLIAAPDSDVARAARTPLEETRYQLGTHCDGCPYNALCFIDTAEREDLSLVPFISASEKRSLAAEGIRSARDLAALMTYTNNAIEPARGRETESQRIGARWPLAGRLPQLAQRARAALHRYDRSIEARNYLLGADFGSLPDAARYPDLVKVFVDAQRDYVEDRLYLIAGLVVGPSQSVEMVEMTSAPPDTEAERDLLVKWIQQLLPAVARVAEAPQAPLHVYLFDSRGQRGLLDALARHFDALCAIPAFYDLLTSSPALTQGMISFLADEVRERRNLAPICQNLYEVARAMGFEWRDEELDFWQRFRARAFDNYRHFVREASTGLLRPAKSDEEKNSLRVESAARFGAEIPLEYAYAAWGRLVETEAMQEKARAQIRGFLGVTMDDISKLAAHRCRALRYLEEAFTRKNRRVEKSPLDLTHLDQVAAAPEKIPFHRSLEDFLHLEHYASHQTRLLDLSLPPDLRAQSGRTLILRCDSFETDTARAAFSFAGASAEMTAGSMRFREGDWIVLNPMANDDGSPLAAWQLVRGRLGTVEEIDGAQVTLRLFPMNFKAKAFRYPHRLFQPQPGALYTIDEMADDLNADKFLDACRNASSNHLYRWLDHPETGQTPRTIRPSRLRLAQEITELAEQAQAPHSLTVAQREVIGELLSDRVLVVQGPPGTGKSHTLGFAILARALALATPARPFRVAVAAKTHAATRIVLASVARRMKDLLAAHPNDPRLAPLAQLSLMKVCADPGEDVPEGVTAITADGGEQSASEQWHDLLTEPLLVIGGTPGGLYNLIKRGASKGKAIDWTEEYFDLVVVDEASQMGIAEALTAAAFLRADGQFIAVGDHRQMPPILQHAWDQNDRRDLQRARPHLSIFEYLIERGFRRAALDESFRIPAEVADFLCRHIYTKDGITFRSHNRQRLAPIANLDGWLAAALAPDHPIVLVEHHEEGSQQANEFEASLIEALVAAASEHLGLDAAHGLGIVVPHRAQKSLLHSRLPQFASAIDTVERFQGGERDLIIVSATASDREFAQLESEFLFEPRRLTVAVSRPKRKLVIIAARTIFDLIPVDLDEYERGSLWKHLRHECEASVLWEGEARGHRLQVRSVGSRKG